MWEKVRHLANEHDYMGGITREKYRVKATGEVFTPDRTGHRDRPATGHRPVCPTKTVIDPACGDGQFLIVALGVKMYHHGMSREDALNDIYGVDIMRDNVDLCKRRLGGGNIVMGNTLDPTTPLDGQTDVEAALIA